MAKTKAPARSINFYIRLAVLSALLIVAAGLSVQNVQINLFAQTNVDEMYAQAVAEQMSKSLQLRLQDTRQLQLAASAHPYTLQALEQGNAIWVEGLKSFMPGSAEVLLITADAARGLHLSYGYAVQELVTRALSGNTMRMEALQKKDQSVRLYWATPITDGGGIAGVLLVEYGPTWLAQFQAAASQELGEVTVVQYVDTAHKYGVEVFRAGHAEKAGKRVTLAITDDWYLSFLPNSERPQLELMPLSLPWIVVLAALAAVLILLAAWQSYDLRRNQYRLTTYLRSLSQSDAETEVIKPKFNLKLFYDLSESMTRLVAMDTLRSTQKRSKPDLPKNSQASTSKALGVDKSTDFIIEELDDDSSFPQS